MDRIAADHQLVDRIVCQRVRIVAIGLSQRDTEHALCKCLLQAVPDLAGLPTVPQAARQGRRQPKLIVNRFEQETTAVRTHRSLVEQHVNGL